MRRFALAVAAVLVLTLGLAVSAPAAEHLCTDYSFQEDAQANLSRYPALDEDGDGIACENLPSRAAPTTAMPSVGVGTTAPDREPATLLPALAGLSAMLALGGLRRWRRA